MTRAALTWSSEDSQKVAELADGARSVIGRESGSDVLLDDPTVSRLQAMVSEDAGRFIIENVSKTNVAKVNDVAAERPVPLSDKDLVSVGRLQLTFHDLQAGDRLSGPMCSHCGRENLSTDKDCWYCGTSLVNAPTAILSRKQVAFRIVADGGDAFDVHPGEVFVVSPAGQPEVVREQQLPKAVGLGVRTDKDKHALLMAESGEITVNGQPPTQPALNTGDILATADRCYLVIVR